MSRSSSFCRMYKERRQAKVPAKNANNAKVVTCDRNFTEMGFEF